MWANKIKIGKKIISHDSPSFIIAEIGSNHNQSMKLAKKLIDLAKKAGADAVKFQSLKLEEDLHHAAIDKNQRKLFDKIELNEKWYVELIRYCKAKNIIFFSSPTYLKSITILKKLKVPVLKVASPLFCINTWLTKKIAQAKLPYIVSNGLSTLEETKAELKSLKKINKKLILLHCVSRYPTKDKELNLLKMIELKERFGCLVGLSDHTRSIDIPSYAVASGARVIEKHFTLSRKMKGPDHPFAMEPNEFSKMVQKIRKIEMIMGSKKSKIFNKEEKTYRKIFIYKCVADKNYNPGNKLGPLGKSSLRHPTKGIDMRKEKILRNKYIVKTKIKKGDLIEWKNLRKT